MHNNKGFDKNAKILIDIIKMWQSVRLTSQTQNQFLGDMFEFFLDNGIKQTEGQFFTPIPICKFIIASLPLEQKISQKAEPLHVIDYACGSGHFLTEYAVAAKPIIEKYKTTPPDQHYQHIYGIEKEDRLAKVATVSACMYGQKEIKVIDTDALANHEALQKESFDVLVANPPFAVEDFLDVLVQNDEKEANTYELFEKANIGTNNIQCFFLERTKHLLAQNGVAGIIVPTSILSNSDQMHIQTREILLKYFDFVSIVELGSGTFGKTGTNTVVLFLKRKAQKPEQAEHFWNRTLDFFENAQEEIDSNGGVYQDLAVLKNYCQHINIPFEQYQILLRNDTQQISQWWQYEIGTAYKSAFEKSSEYNNLLKKTEFKKLTPTEQQEKTTLLLLEYIRKIEQQKLFYFMLAQHNPQEVLLVKSPADSKEQKKFLGYEWTNAKGQEGIKYTGGETVYDIITPLFNPNLRHDASKIAYHIANNFDTQTQNQPVPDNLKEWLVYAPLTDLLDFSRTSFNKAISLAVKQNAANVLPISRWEMVRLGEVVDTLNGLWSGKKPPFIKVTVIRNTNFVKGGYFDLSDVAELEVEIAQYEKRKLLFGDIIVEKSGGSETQAVGRVVFFDKKEGEYSYSNFTSRLRLNTNKINAKFLHLFLNYFYELGLTMNMQNGTSGIKNLDFDKYLSTKIPLPPLSVQEQIVLECEVIDRVTETAKNAVEKAKREIEEKVKSWFNNPEELIVLTEIIKLQNGKGLTQKNFVAAGNYLVYGGNGVVGKHNDYIFSKETLVIGRVGEYCGAVHIAEPMSWITDNAMFVNEFLQTINIKFLYYALKQLNLNQFANRTSQPNIAQPIILAQKIPVPPLAVQEQLVSEIVLLEGIILEQGKQIEQAGASKRLVLERYL